MNVQGGLRRARLAGIVAVSVLASGCSVMTTTVAPGIDASVPRPAVLDDVAAVNALFPVNSDGSPRRTKADGTPEAPRWTVALYQYLISNPEPVEPAKPVRPAAPVLPKWVDDGYAKVTLPAPLPELPKDIASLGRLSCAEVARRVNGPTAACMPPAKLSRAIRVPRGAVLFGYTTGAGQVFLNDSLTGWQLYSTALHERGHQIQLRDCSGGKCQEALDAAVDSSQPVPDPYYAQPSEVAAEAYNGCHGGVRDRSFIHLGCAELNKVLAVGVQERKDHEKRVKAHDAAVASYEAAVTAFPGLLAQYTKDVASYEKRHQLWAAQHDLWRAAQAHRAASN